MVLQRGFRSLKKKLCLSHSKESYGRLDEIPEDQTEDDSHPHDHHHHHQQLTVPKGFVPIIVGDVEGMEGKKYMIQVEYLSSPSFKALIDQLWKEQVMELDLEDESEGPMKLPCTPAAFEQVLEACKDRRRSFLPKFLCCRVSSTMTMGF